MAYGVYHVLVVLPIRQQLEPNRYMLVERHFVVLKAPGVLEQKKEVLTKVAYSGRM